MSQSSIARFLALATLVVPAVLSAQTTPSPLDGHFEGPLLLSNSCAVNTYVDNGVTRIVYGDLINFAIKGTVQVKSDITSKGEIRYRYAISVHGDGTGTSGTKYEFNSKAYMKADLSLGSFDEKFKLTARIISQGNSAGSGSLAKGAQDNALLRYTVNIRFDKGTIQAWTSDYSLQCVGSPWTNLMGAPYSVTKTPVGRGFGDSWNKYAWSMKDFNGGMLVGTKNAYFDYFATQNPSAALKACHDSLGMAFPSIYRDLACLELMGERNDLGLPEAATAFAEIWRFDYSKKNWTRVFDALNDYSSQGFRVMTTHQGRLYVGSDLGSFVTGISLGSGVFPNPLNPLTWKWDFPGSKLLRSADGINFTPVTCTPNGPCNSAPQTSFVSGIPPSSPDVNVSFRALASYDGKLYLGTFNFTGGELWSYDDTSTTPWYRVCKFDGHSQCAGSTPAPFSAAITELAIYNGKLYIGLFGQPSQAAYLYSYDSLTSTLAPAGMPIINPTTNLGVLKLFVARDRLFVGNVDLDKGFNLLSYTSNLTGGGGVWSDPPITSDGFGNNDNAYAWSMVEVDGRIFVGTFNQDFFMDLPRGSAELWYSDDLENWYQVALPLGWGEWNYGIRTMEVGDNKQLYLGSASQMLAPGLPGIPGVGIIPLSPGAEVWTIKTNLVDPKK